MLGEGPLFPVALAFVDGKGLIIESNSLFDDLTGSGGKPEALLRGAGERAALVPEFLSRGGAQSLRLPFLLPDGNTRNLQLKVRALGEDRFVIAASDVTDYHEILDSFGIAFERMITSAGEMEVALKLTQQEKSDNAEVLRKLELAHEFVRRDLELARTLQTSLLPRIPKSKNWEISYFFKPMHGVSGDIIDIYTFGDVFFGDEEQEENIGIILMDASGHGISSALITAIARPILFSNHRLYKDEMLWKAMMDANVELCQAIGSVPNYLTCVSLRLTNRQFSYVNAGHPYVLYRRTKTGKVYELENDGVLLGIPDLKRDLHSRRAEVLPDDLLMIYSDGLTEAENPAGEPLGVEPIKNLMAGFHGNTDELREAVIQLTRDHGINLDQIRDDITFAVVRKK